MSGFTPNSAHPANDNNASGQTDYTFALTSLTSLFFMWGFITCLNDILIPYLKGMFSLNYTQAMLIQFCFFGAYFVMSIPAGKLVSRIGYQFIYPGCGYGGSCFPKDVQALIRTSDGIGYESELLKAVEAVNYRQKEILFSKIHDHFGGDLKGKTFALWGLSFKPNTDDMREAPSRVLMEALWAAGARVQAFDPEAMPECQRIYGQRDDLTLMGTQEAALQDADALVLVTEWQQFKSPDFAHMVELLRQPVIFDGRNQYNPEYMGQYGISYYSIGRNVVAS